jgi:hypothetical protein
VLSEIGGISEAGRKKTERKEGVRKREMGREMGRAT